MPPPSALCCYIAYTPYSNSYDYVTLPNFKIFLIVNWKRAARQRTAEAQERTHTHTVRHM